jgi:hypothetical protein
MKTLEQAIGFTPGMLFSNGYVAGNTLCVTGRGRGYRRSSLKSHVAGH